MHRHWWRWRLIAPAWGLYWEMRGYYDAGRGYSRLSRRDALLDTVRYGWRRPGALGSKS